MAGHPARDPDTDRGQLLTAYPDTGEAVYTTRLDSVVAGRANQHFFEITDVSMDVLPIGSQTDDRIANDLSGSVIRDIAAAASLVHLDAARAQQIGRRQNVRTAAITPHAERQDMRMLNEQQRVINRAAYPILDECALQGERIAVGHASEAPDD